jgi:predicted metal-binding membrane protein
MPDRVHALIERPDRILAWGLVLIIATVTWGFTVRDAADMANGLGTMGFGPVQFVIMWTFMMAAMMLPSVGSTAAAYSGGIRRTSSSVLSRGTRLCALITGYLAVWAAFGAGVFGLIVVLEEWARAVPSIMPTVTVVFLVGAGLYQFSGFKQKCLTRCRSILSFLVRFAEYRGPFRDMRAGAYHGMFCSGCCLGLMLVLIPMGVMNILWMVLLAVVVVLEKTWSRGVVLSKIVGVTLLVFAGLVAASPALAPGLSPEMNYAKGESQPRYQCLLSRWQPTSPPARPPQ